MLAVLFLFLSPYAQAENTEKYAYEDSHSPSIQTGANTPIQHLVILYDENVSFDHYFGTYPYAANPSDSPPFTPLANTPAVNGFFSATMNSSLSPFRLDRRQAATADQSHHYRHEQAAFNHGLMDRFVENTGHGYPNSLGELATARTVMGFFDGNTVTALWNYAQHFTLDDATFTDTFGPSTPGVLELISGQTHGLIPLSRAQVSDALLPDGRGDYTLTGDLAPASDVCNPDNAPRVRMKGRNIGDLMNDHHLSWGNFMGGFDLTRHNPNGSTGCLRKNLSAWGTMVRDYLPHHNGFQYYPSTANPTHTRPDSVATIGHSWLPDGKTPEPANHQYDLEDFFRAVSAGNFPAVSILKAAAYQDGHAGYSDPLSEQHFIVRVMNFLQQRPEWASTAVIITYDDSDGWFDHVFPHILHTSSDPVVDVLTKPGQCGEGPLPMGYDNRPVNGRCGPGPRIPLLVISPWVRTNYVDHTLLTQTSILRFIEDNWLGKERLGHGSFDAAAPPLNSVFDFSRTTPSPPLLLDEEWGTPVDKLP
ncbi:MAG: alkaline phosphatase family protein [Betaproteobacteria bacterium]|nr:alkaline phosphatase family protein [Betaproteobacteria bacterium]